jgi:putative PEP-CTERM system TPR-repeat lipoprotein
MQFSVVMRLLAALALVLSLLAAGCSGETSEDFLAEGRKLMEQGNSSGAIVFFKSALEKEPQLYEARLALGQAYAAEGKLDQAETAFQKCLRQNASDPELRLALARLYTQLRKSRDTIEHVNAYEGLKGRSAETEELKGIALAMGGNAPGAEDALRSALQLEPRRISSRLALARLYASTGRVDEARTMVGEALAISPADHDSLLLAAELTRYSGDDAAITAAYRTLSEQYPDDKYARYMIGAQEMKTGNLDAARQTTAAMRTRFGDDALVLMLEGMLAYADKDYEAAARAFQRSVSARPTLDAFFRLGLAQVGLGDLETALSQFRVVLDKQPQHAEARRMVAATLLRQNRIEDAQAEARRLVEMHPDYPWGHFLLASAAMARGDMELAARELDVVTSLAPAMAEAHLQKSYINISSGRFDLAESDLNSAVSASPGNIQARVALFQFNMGRGRFDEAEKVLTEGMNGTPRDAVLWNYIAGMYQLRRDDAKALEALEKAQQADPDLRDSYMTASRIRAAAGDEAGALEQLERYLQRHPDDGRFLVVSAVLLDLTGDAQKAGARLDRARELDEPSALPATVSRLMSRGETDKARQLLQDAYAASGSLRDLSMLTGFLTGQGRTDEALALYEAYAAKDPVAAARGIFAVHTLKRDYQKALEQARKLSDLEASSPEGALQEAATMERMGDPAAALARLEEAYRKFQAPQLLIAQASVARRMDNIDKAEAYIRTCLKAVPDFIPAKVAAAELAHQRGRLDEAAAAYEEILQRVPDDAAVMNNLAMIYVRDEATLRRALQLALTAYVRQPDSPQIMDTLGLCLTAAGRPAEAVRVLRRASALLPDDQSIRYHYAQALAAAGEKGAALKEVSTALQGSEFSEAGEARKLLKKLGG